MATPAKASPSGDLGDAAAQQLGDACASARPHIVAVQQRGRLAPWFDPSEFELRLRAGLPDQSQVGAVANGYIDTADDAAVRGTLSLANGALVVADLSPAEERVDVFLTGHCFPAPRSERALPGDLLVSWQPPPAAPEPLDDGGSPADGHPTVPDGLLPALVPASVATLRAAVPACGAALDTYEATRRHARLNAALPMAFMATTGFIAATTNHREVLIAGASASALSFIIVRSSGHPGRARRDANQCLIDAGARLDAW